MSSFSVTHHSPLPVGTRMKFEPSSDDFEQPHEVCTFSQHAYCASPRMRNFTYVYRGWLGLTFSILLRWSDSHCPNVCSQPLFMMVISYTIEFFLFQFLKKDCDCDPSCLSVHFSVENIVYGSWRKPLMTKKPNISVGSFMITGSSLTVSCPLVFIFYYSARRQRNGLWRGARVYARESLQWYWRRRRLGLGHVVGDVFRRIGVLDL